MLGQGPLFVYLDLHCRDGDLVQVLDLSEGLGVRDGNGLWKTSHRLITQHKAEQRLQTQHMTN